MNSNDMSWITQKIFQYQDPVTSNFLILNLETGISVTDSFQTFHPTRLSLQIKDPRIPNNKNQFEFNINEACAFNAHLSNNFSIRQAFDNEFKFDITKIGSVRKKLSVRFFKMEDNKPAIEFLIYSGDSGNKAILCTNNIFFTVKLLIWQFQNNYLMISNGLMNICNNDRHLKKLNDIHNELKFLRRDNIRLSDTMADIVEENMKKVEIDPDLVDVEYSHNNSDENTTDILPISEFSEKVVYDIEQPAISESTAFAEDFNSVISHAIEKDLEPEVANIIENQMKKIEKIHIDNDIDKLPTQKVFCSFFENILDNDVDKLNRMVTAFNCANKKSKDDLFSPISFIIKQCAPTESINFIDSDLYNAEYIMNNLQKLSTCNYLKEGKILDNTPVYLFNKKITKDSELYNSALDILVLYLIYFFFVARYVNKLSNTTSNYVEEVNVSLSYLKVILLSFVVSIDIRDWSEFEKDVLERFTKINTESNMKNLRDKYKSISMGGNFTITKSTEDALISKFIDALKNRKIKTFDITDKKIVCENFNIIEPDINALEDIKSNMVVVIEQKLKDDKSKRQLPVFKECVFEELSIELKNKLNLIQHYSELDDFIKNNNVNEKVFKIKRILDLNPTFDKKAQVIKEYKKFNEDDNVTAVRVLNQDKLLDDSSLDVLIDDDYEKILNDNELGEY